MYIQGELFDSKQKCLRVVLLIILLTLSFNVGYSQEDDESDPKLHDPNYSAEIVAQGFENPTGMAFLGQNDMLVAEKNKGTVQRISNGQMLEEPLLDVNVNARDERGLLGIAIANNNLSADPYVFLYYTEAEGEDGGDPIGNRLYRYELKDNKLVNPKLLLDLPFLPGPAHNGGALAIGPDMNVYLTIGDMIPTAYSQEEYQSTAQNYNDGKDPDGRGGILRVTQDGEVVDNKGILGDDHPLDKYYAYGIRNSFGIGFDPITGNLWDTENGPSYGDEINLVEPGFNSGWAKILGTWSVNETIKEGNRQVNKGPEISSFVLESSTENLVSFAGHGNYSDPELIWEGSVGPTSITFLDSDELGKGYGKDIFVGNVEGQIYHFGLVTNRTQLALTGELSDKIAQDSEELEDSIFASNLGIITDLEVGPDGYLYVLTGVRDVEGKIYRITPVSKNT